MKACQSSKRTQKWTKNFQQSSPYNSSAVSQVFWCHFDSSWFVVCKVFTAKTALCEAVKELLMYNIFMKVKALIQWHYFPFTHHQNFFLHTIKICSNKFRESFFIFFLDCNLIAIASHFKGAFLFNSRLQLHGFIQVYYVWRCYLRQNHFILQAINKQ